MNKVEAFSAQKTISEVPCREPEVINVMCHMESLVEQMQYSIGVLDARLEQFMRTPMPQDPSEKREQFQSSFAERFAQACGKLEAQICQVDAILHRLEI